MFHPSLPANFLNFRKGELVNKSRREATAAELLTHLETPYTLARWVLMDPMAMKDAMLKAGQAVPTASCRVGDQI
jgi:hypothetical protein